MLPTVSSLQSQLPVGLSAKQATARPTETSSENVFGKLLTQANTDQQQSDQAIKSLVSGETDDIQHVVMQVVKAEMSFQLFMEVRNQLIESYNELMRMQF